MITRAQAEALLTLAESLEACERLNLEFQADYEGMLHLCHADTGNQLSLVGALGPSNLRTAVADLMPETGRDEYRYTLGPKGVTDQCRLVKPKQD